MEIGFRAWLLRRDPDLLAVRRAARVTVVACLGFYVCYYLVDNPVMATYALFGAVAMGFLSRIPGRGARRGGSAGDSAGAHRVSIASVTGRPPGGGDVAGRPGDGAGRRGVRRISDRASRRA